jgi:hypothetical protein
MGGMSAWFLRTLFVLVFAIAGAARYVSASETSQPQDPLCIGWASDRFAALERYIELIDSLMNPERINAAHVEERLWKNIPPCQYTDESEVLEFAKRSRYFTRFGGYDGQFTFYFVAKKEGGEFGVTLQFNRRGRTIFPSARHLNTL